jgi:hypothetical protein
MVVPFKGRPNRGAKIAKIPCKGSVGVPRESRIIIAYISGPVNP